jgi:hypothetical protein
MPRDDCTWRDVEREVGGDYLIAFCQRGLRHCPFHWCFLRGRNGCAWICHGPQS